MQEIDPKCCQQETRAYTDADQDASVVRSPSPYLPRGAVVDVFRACVIVDRMSKALLIKALHLAFAYPTQVLAEWMACKRPVYFGYPTAKST